MNTIHAIPLLLTLLGRQAVGGDVAATASASASAHQPQSAGAVIMWRAAGDSLVFLRAFRSAAPSSAPSPARTSRRLPEPLDIEPAQLSDFERLVAPDSTTALMERFIRRQEGPDSRRRVLPSGAIERRDSITGDGRIELPRRTTSSERRTVTVTQRAGLTLSLQVKIERRNGARWEESAQVFRVYHPNGQLKSVMLMLPNLEGKAPRRGS